MSLHSMSLRLFLLFFGLARSFALLSKDLQSIVNEKLLPSDLVKMKATDPNWKGEGIFERITKAAGLFMHKKTNEIILETKEKLWTESEIIEKLGLELDEFKNLVKTRDWNELFLFCDIEKYWLEALAEIVLVNKKYENDETVLMRAVQCEDSRATKILIERGAHVNAIDCGGWTALHMAAFSNKIEAIELLIESDAEINPTTNIHKETPLMWAVQTLKLDAVKVLLGRGARLDMKNDEGKTALEMAKVERDEIRLHFDIEARLGAKNDEIIELLETQQTKSCLGNEKE